MIEPRCFTFALVIGGGREVIPTDDWREAVTRESRYAGMDPWLVRDRDGQTIAGNARWLREPRIADETRGAEPGEGASE